MRAFLYRMWRADDGVLTFEWTMLASLLTIGVVGGVATSRDAIIDELGDVSQAMLALDQSYTIDYPLFTMAHAPNFSSGSDSGFFDAVTYIDCDRTLQPFGQERIYDDETVPPQTQIREFRDLRDNAPPEVEE